MVDRILGLLKEKSMSASQFADEIGVLRSSVSHIISGRNKPSLEFVMKILKRFPDVDSNWLLFGTEPVAASKVPDLENQRSRQEDSSLNEEDVPQYEKIKPVQRAKTVKAVSENKSIERLILIHKDNTFREVYPE
jgi:transcriptional regulator with XRE-family HTH domain